MYDGGGDDDPFALFFAFFCLGHLCHRLDAHASEGIEEAGLGRVVKIGEGVEGVDAYFCRRRIR